VVMLDFIKQQIVSVVHHVPVVIHVREVLLDVAPVYAEDVMDLLASVKRTSVSVTSLAV